ncbi:MAG: L-aspartate oxidase [Candidatus Cyclobacteriaceae bacterium M2_1C_046]
MTNYKQISTDVLIIGEGAAGLSAAIELTKGNVPCFVITKRDHGDAHTKWAAGGINASFGNLDEEDSWQVHAADTIREGQFICSPKAVELLTKKAPERVKELQEWGCSFNKTNEGKINQRYFGAQSFRRTCFVGDRTGEAILKTLVKKAGEVGVPYRANTYIIQLLIKDGKAAGAIGFDMKTGEQLMIKAKAVVLACGGFASIYNRSTSRTDENTADSVGLGYDAAATLQDMEMVQFHPTGMVKPDDMAGRLVSEAVRGEGGYLLNKDKERFMENYDPEKMELAARDVVARAILQEINEGRGTPDGGVYLDISHKDADYIEERLPKLVKRFKEYDIDISEEPVEVAPTSHYAMGGLRVNFKTGETTVPGLFAAGEATAGVHGANRLGGNSLAETVVFGKITGNHLQEIIDSIPKPDVEENFIKENFKTAESKITKLNSGETKHMITKIRDLLWEHAGIVRNKENLEAGLHKLKSLFDSKGSSENGKKSFTPKDRELAYNLFFIKTAAEAVIRGALLRNESRGAHYREDATDQKEEWIKNIYYRKKNEEMELFTESVPDIPEPIKKALEEEHELDYHHLE